MNEINEDRRRTIRRGVIAAIVDVMRDAMKQGLEPWAAAKRTFPDVPIGPITEAWMIVDDEQEEEFWESITRTIDAEIIRKTLVGGGGA